MDFRRHAFQTLFFTSFALLFQISPAVAITETITFSEDGKRKTVEGRLLYEFAEFVVLQGRDGQIHRIAPKDISDRRLNDHDFVPMEESELIKELEKEFPETFGFKILKGKRYIVVYNTSRAYADWAMKLFEQLYDSYLRFWRQRGAELDKHDFPLVAVIFRNPVEFNSYALKDAGGTGMAAYYNVLSNRIILCDLMGIETFLAQSTKKATSSDLEAFLDRPLAAYNIATIIHEATHQVGYNCGMHERLSPTPVWICEGLAVLHEVPTRDRRTGWSISLKINGNRLTHLRRYLSTRPDRPLQRIIESDKPFHIVSQQDAAADSYAMAWGLTYYLANKKPKELTAYLAKVGNKSRLAPDAPEIRIKDFEDCFGDDWDKLYKDLGKYLKGLMK